MIEAYKYCRTEEDFKAYVGGEDCWDFDSYRSMPNRGPHISEYPIMVFTVIEQENTSCSCHPYYENLEVYRYCSMNDLLNDIPAEDLSFLSLKKNPWDEDYTPPMSNSKDSNSTYLLEEARETMHSLRILLTKIEDSADPTVHNFIKDHLLDIQKAVVFLGPEEK